MDLKHLFGKNVKFYRYNKKYTQEVLAEKTGISVNYLGRLERGKHSVDFDVIQKLAKNLDIEPHELFVKIEDKKLPRRVDMNDK